jgi:hypothetical protein
MEVAVFRRAVLCVSLIVASAASPLTAGEPARLMSAKSIPEQRDVLSHAVESAGHDCPQVAEHMYGGEKSGMDFFSVRCQDASEYMVSIEGAGEMRSRVMVCDVLAALGVLCFEPL